MRLTVWQSIVVLALDLPFPVFGQTVARADLVGVWVREDKIPGATFKTFAVFRDDSTYNEVYAKELIMTGGDSVTHRTPTRRWLLSGDTLWISNGTEPTSADLRTIGTISPLKVKIDNDTLYQAPYSDVDKWNKANPGKPFRWLPLNLVRSKTSAP